MTPRIEIASSRYALLAMTLPPTSYEDEVIVR